MKSLINRKACKEFSLECAKSRYHKFTRVSKEFLESIEFNVMQTIRQKVTGSPSKGKTLWACSIRAVIFTILNQQKRRIKCYQKKKTIRKSSVIFVWRSPIHPSRNASASSRTSWCASNICIAKNFWKRPAMLSHRFKPLRALWFSEMPYWVVRVNDENREELEKNDKRKKG